MKKLFIAIDNGISGTIGVIGETTDFFKTPTVSVSKYTKAKANITRVDHKKLMSKLTHITNGYLTEEIMVSLERPMVNPRRFNASASALRAFEATLVVLEQLNLPYSYIDSKEWQKVMLQKGLKGSEQLKKASLSVGNRLFPQFKENKHKDRDGILMAEYLRTKYKN